MIDGITAAAAESLQDVRVRSDAYCHGMMCEMMGWARCATAGMRVIFDAQAKGFGCDPGSVAALEAFRRRVDFCREHVVIFAVRRAILSGRWPEADEAEAFERCRTDDGMMAFLDEISRIPIGFVDLPVTPQVRH